MGDCDVGERLREKGFQRIAGIDEVGRGPLAGPVVAAAVILADGISIPGAADSKRLSAAQRNRLSRTIQRVASAVSFGAASVGEIDRLNIRGATALAMVRAVRGIQPPPDHLLVDGLAVAELGLDRQTAIVGGDGSVPVIACASIVAKVLRDRLLCKLALRYPAYGWDRNKGYGTAEHVTALRVHGPTPHHRKSFRPVVESIDNPDRVVLKSGPH